MSVLVPDLEVFNYLRNALQRVAYNREVNEWWSHSIYTHMNETTGFDIEKECKRLCVSWLDLNELSYDCRYNKKPDKNKLSKFVDWGVVFDLDPWQVLKYVQCVLYNIELLTINDAGIKITEQMKKDYDLLTIWESDISKQLISMNPKYKEAEWSDKPKTKTPQL